MLQNQTSRNPVIISESSEDEVDRNFFKIILLGVLGAALNVAAIYKFNGFVETFDYTYLWLAASGSAGFLILLILKTFFVKRMWLMSALLFIETLAPLAIFKSSLFPNADVALVGAWAAFFVLTLWGAGKGMRLLQNTLTVSFFPAARAVLAKSITGLLIFLSVIVYSAYVKAGKFNDEIGQKMMSGVLSSSGPIVSTMFPGVSFDQTIKEFLDVIAKAQLRKMNAASLRGAQGEVSPQIQRTLILQISGGLLNALQDAVGPIDENSPVKIAVYKLARGYMENLPPNIKNAAGILLIVFVFLTLKGIAFFLYWFVELIAFLAFKLLIITGFAYVNLQQRSREFIMLS